MGFIKLIFVFTDNVLIRINVIQRKVLFLKTQMKYYLGVTDNNWYSYLKGIIPEDVNFWQPGGNVNFKALAFGAPFLFKLKYPYNAIGGVGFFSTHSFLPISIAWEVFGNRNGCNSYIEFQRMILNYRSDKTNINPQIGCIVLTNPIFFDEKDWIPVPESWSKSIVQGKSYNTDDLEGQQLWNKVELLLNNYMANQVGVKESELLLQESSSPQYGPSVLTKVRIGQGAFRVMVTEAYTRRCAITGEKTLPVLESAHIKSYAEAGPHLTSNGILLRSDIHKLFDNGYVTITKDLRIEVSSRIREEFSNGKEYYQYHGKQLLILPDNLKDRPNSQFVEWHNENVFRG
jgi:putative restriction endonuclease